MHDFCIGPLVHSKNSYIRPHLNFIPRMGRESKSSVVKRDWNDVPGYQHVEKHVVDWGL